jgi:hypothetical protein
MGNGYHRTNKMKFINTWLFVILICFSVRGSVTTPQLQAVVQTNGVFRFIWSTVPKQTYLIQYKTNLIQTNWNILGGAVQAASTAATGVDAMVSGSSGRFYRLWLLQTNASDVTKPTLTITAPTASQRWSNSTFVVKGTATDNKQVAAAFFQLNSNVWATAITTNRWTNWNSSVLLLPGTNTIAAYAVDTNANYSTTSRVSVVYVVSGMLQIRTTGQGTVSPNYSNALLQIGSGYSMKATATNGFAFTNWIISTNWIGGVISNNATVSFIMRSNLTLQANFVDTNRPVVSITNVVSGMQVSNANYVVQGTATDNVAVASVHCQLNGMGWANPTSFNGRNWSDGVTLNPGTNQFQAYAVDTGGNLSITNTVNIVYVVSAILAVRTNGIGSLSPNDNGALLQIGKGYSITASNISGSGFTFTNWTGGTSLPLSFVTNGTTVQFQMVTNLMLQANFVDTAGPTVTVTSPAANQVVSNGTLVATGTAHDNVQVAGVFCQFNGADWINATTTNSWTNWTATLNLIPVANSVKTSGETERAVSRQDPGPDIVRTYGADTNGNHSITNVVIFIRLKPAIQIPRLPHALVGQYYSQVAATATGGTPPYAFTLETAGGFPPIGIHLDGSGNLTGTPSAAGTYPFGVCVVDLMDTESCSNTMLVVDPVYQLTITTAGTGGGSVTAAPSGYPPGLIYTNGTKVTLTAVPDAGSTFTGWSGAVVSTATRVPLTINGNQSVTASFNNPDAIWNGTWNSTQTYVSSDGICSRTVTANISLVLSVSSGNVAGSGTDNGVPCFNDGNCSVYGYPTVTGPVSGSVSGSTINIYFAGVANGGVCAGQSVDISFTATMINSNTISGTTASGRAFSYTKQ